MVEPRFLHALSPNPPSPKWDRLGRRIPPRHFSQRDARLAGWCKALARALFVLVPLALHGQTISTVREAEFRSRWANYQVDQPRVELTPRVRPSDEESGIARAVAPVIDTLFGSGPFSLHGSLTNGWEYSNANASLAGQKSPSTSSFFTAPSLLAAYDRDRGPWTVSARYSAGYVRYLDRDYSPSSGGAGGLSQTAGLDLARIGSRLALRSSTSFSNGTGYDIQRGGETKRTSVAENFSADYPLTEFIRAGASLITAYELYSDQQNASDNTQNRWAATVYGESVLTGKTELRLELGAGQTTGNQTNGSESSIDRSYYQGLVRMVYRPTVKLTLTPGLGFGVLQETGQVNAGETGLRAVYSLAVDYVPTEKTSVRLSGGVEGSAQKPEFLLAVNWHPRANSTVSLSAYQQSGLSTIDTVQNQTTRGVLGTIRQRFFQKVDAGLSAGWEQVETDDSGSQSSVASQDPYYLVVASIAWQMNRWLIWQAQFQTTSRPESAANQAGNGQTRGSVSFRLTF